MSATPLAPARAFERLRYPRLSRGRPRLLHGSWVAVLALAMLISSDYKLRTRPATSSLSGAPDLQTLVELGVYAAVGGFLLLQLGSPPSVRRVTPLLFSAWGWAVVMALSFLWAVYPLFAAVRGVQLLLIAAFAHAISVSARREHLHLLAHGYIALCTVSVVLGLVVPHPNLARTPRFSWFYVHPVVVGAYLGLAVTIIVAYLIRSRPSPRTLSWPTWVYAVTLAVCTAGLLGTRTRGALGAAFIAVLVALMFSSRGPRRADIAVVFIVILVIALLAYAPEITQFLARGESAQKIESFNGRTPLWTQALALFGQRPVIGYGLTSANGLFLDTVGLGGGHNAFINVLTDGGLVGTTFWLGLIFGIFVSLRRLWRFPSVRADLPMLLAIMVFLVVESITDEGLGSAANISNIWCFVLVGWLGVLAGQVRREASVSTPR